MNVEKSDLDFSVEILIFFCENFYDNFNKITTTRNTNVANRTF